MACYALNNILSVLLRNLTALLKCKHVSVHVGGNFVVHFLLAAATKVLSHRKKLLPVRKQKV